MLIRPATRGDAERISAIYNHYIGHTVATFELQPTTPQQIVDRMERYPDHPWLVVEQNNMVHGYAYASPWKPRAAYHRTAEVSIYLDHTITGSGLGTPLYTRLVEILTDKKLHTLLAGISLPNPGSVRFHERMGFKKVGHLKEVGHKFEQWIDVGYWQLLLT